MIVLIGASSFIGVYTAEKLLAEGCDIIVTGRNGKFKEHYDSIGVPYVNLDVCCKEDFSALPSEGVEGVILLAGLLPANVSTDLDKDENAEDYFKVNVLGTINVLEYCRRNGIRKVLSTCSYADVALAWNAERPLTEEEPRAFSHSGDHAVYVFSKNASNDLLEYYNVQHGMSNVVFRLPPVYGAGPHGSYCINGKLTKSAIQKFIDKAEAGEDIVIYRGDEGYIRDFAYVKDVARAFYMAVKSERAKGLYNMTSGRGCSLADQARIISEVFCNGHRSRLVYSEKDGGEHKSYLFSMEKAERDFGFIPEYSSFRTMMEDYRKDLKNRKYQNLFKY